MAKEPVCPRSELHHPDAPIGYLASADWADKMAKTHVQRKCPGCGLWKIWTEKKRVSE